MNRESRAVLRRMAVTALGALGLGALATGPVVAQDQEQIPAPRLYGDISTCAGGNLPSASTAAGAESLLGMGGVLDMAFDSDPDTNGIQMDFTDDDVRIITADTDNESMSLLELLSLTDCTNPVANNIGEARTLYTDYLSAKKTFEDLEEPDADDRAEYNTAKQNKDAIAGDVYNAVFDQEAKKRAADKAIADFNKLVGSTGTLAQLRDNVDTTSGTAADGGYDDISIVAGDRVTDWNDAPEDGDGNALEGEDLDENLNNQVRSAYGRDATGGYRAIRGSDEAEATAAASVASGEATAAFNEAGALQFEESNRSNAFDRASETIVTLGHIRHELGRWQTLVDTYDTALDNAKKAGNLDTREEEEQLRRAELARDHVNDELVRLTRIVRSQNRDIVEANRVTIAGTGTNDDVVYRKERDLVDAYLKADGDAKSAATKVRTAITNLDSANRALQTKLKQPDSYLNQLVTLREYEEKVAEDELKEAGGDDAIQAYKDAVADAGKAVAAAKAQRTAHLKLTSDPDSTTSNLLTALLEPDTDDDGDPNPLDDDGQALLTAISGVDSKVSTLTDQLTDAEGNPIDLSNLDTGVDELTAMDDPDTMEDESGPVTRNANDITKLDGRVAENEDDLDRAWLDLYGTARDVEAQHDDLAACEATGAFNVANCANARSIHNGETLEDHAMKLEAKKMYIETLAEEIGVDPVTGMGTEANGMSRIDNNETRSMANETAIAAETTARMAADTALGGRIDANVENIATNATNIMTNAGNIMTNAENIAAEKTARMDADEMLAGGIDANAKAIMDEAAARESADMGLSGRINSNADAIAANMNSIGSNASAIGDNRNMIGELSDDLDVVRAGVAASMALAGMPAINGRGISIGVGSFDGESAFAVGFQIQGEQASFKVGVTSASGATGASAGVGFNF